MARKERKRKLYRGLVGRAKGSCQLGHRLKRNTNKMGLKESLWDRSDWINLDQDRDKWRVVVKTVIEQDRIQHILVSS